MAKKFKLPKIKQKHVFVLMIALMLVPMIFGASSMFKDDEKPILNNDNPVQIGTWNGNGVYAKSTAANTSIYYLDIGGGYWLPMRADPRDAALVESDDTNEIYSTIYSSEQVFLPFELVMGTTTEYTDDFNKTHFYWDPFNTTENQSVVYLKISNETKLSLINRTIIVEGTNSTILNSEGKLQMLLMRLI